MNIINQKVEFVHLDYRTLIDNPLHKRMSKKKNISKRKLVNAIRKNGGVISLVANELGCSRQNVYDRIKADKEVSDVLDDVINRTGDAVENIILNAMTTGVVYRPVKQEDGEARMVAFNLDVTEQVKTAKWYAERKLKDRGYTTRVEQTGKDGEELKSAVLVINGQPKHKAVTDESDIIEG